jgi:general secretion pathway protein N
VSFSTAARSGVGLALLALLAVALTVVVRAPAAWLGDWVQSQGRLRLIDARGTIWEGSAMLALSDGRQAMLIPGRVSWKVGLGPILSGRVTVTVAHPAAPAPLELALGVQEMALKAGRAEMPAAMLGALGAPFNTVRPGGVLELRWTDIEVRTGVFAGSLDIEWREAQSVLSAVAPLGNFRLHVGGAGDAVRLQLDTLRGPLHLEGNGTLKNGHLSFKGLASADAEMRPALNGLIGVLGPRSGDNALLVIEK